MTGAVAAITVTGTFYGAGLKTDQEVKKVRRRQSFFNPSSEQGRLVPSRSTSPASEQIANSL